MKWLYIAINLICKPLKQQCQNCQNFDCHINYKNTYGSVFCMTRNNFFLELVAKLASDASFSIFNFLISTQWIFIYFV